jgi:hypothetical protein
MQRWKNKYIEKSEKKCVKLVENPQLPQDARSTEYKILMWRSCPSILLLPSEGKAIPLHAWTGPEGSRRLRLPDFKTIGT